MLTAWSPFWPAVMSNVTFWFSCRLLKPLPWIAEKCANRSLPPPSGVMKPKPLASLNHLTVPVLMSLLPRKINNRLAPEMRELQGGKRRPEEYRGRGYDGPAIPLPYIPAVVFIQYLRQGVNTI